MFVASLGESYPKPQATYNTAKEAVTMRKNCLAVAWAAHGMRVNSISPGYLDTTLTQSAVLAEVKSAWLNRNPPGRMGQGLLF
ncbi:hypothetical protein PG994_014788 [Apiospora phragmitis]|uniref:Uncharacterized protein n=1 Tax=Apiospora phragmitis TaxID=2905665 RepID=A0ABR1SUN2_9PEZI